MASNTLARAACCAVVFSVAGLLSLAQAYTEAPPKLREPWAGYWWPMYDDPGPGSSPRLWKGGGGIYGSPPGPIYDHDTRYFWLLESIRDSAQAWEYCCHRTTDTLLKWKGHCDGVTCASILVSAAPPSDCGALSHDLEGLLAEIYSDCALYPRTYGKVKPSNMWLALRTFVGGGGLTAPKPIAVDFDTADVWYYAVYGYRIDGDLINDTTLYGVMTLYYERHTYGAQHDSASAWYDFQCRVAGNSACLWPIPGTGTWGGCHGPSGLNSPPDLVCTAESMPHRVYGRNPYVCDSTLAGLDTLMRVIKHKTIILDDAFRDSTEPVDPPSGFWVRRPGFVDSCWAVQEPPMNPEYHMHWYPPLCSAGQWSVYAYKTPPVEGDTLNDNANVWLMPLGYWSFDQSQAPFDTWQLLGTCYVDPASFLYVCADNKWWSPWNCYTYYDAVRPEFVGGSEDGGASSAMVKLGDLAKRIRVWPSPARGRAQISYALHKAGPVDIVVYDVMGRAVLRSPQGNQRAGPQTATVSVAGLPSGTYVARVTAKGFNTTCRFVVCR